MTCMLAHKSALLLPVGLHAVDTSCAAKLNSSVPFVIVVIVLPRKHQWLPGVDNTQAAHYEHQPATAVLHHATCNVWQWQWQLLHQETFMHTRIGTHV